MSDRESERAMQRRRRRRKRKEAALSFALSFRLSTFTHFFLKPAAARLSGQRVEITFYPLNRVDLRENSWHARCSLLLTQVTQPSGAIEPLPSRFLSLFCPFRLDFRGGFDSRHFRRVLHLAAQSGVRGVQIQGAKVLQDGKSTNIYI